MGLIKKYHKKIITYSFFLLGVLSIIIIFLLHPQKTSIQTSLNYDSMESELTEISFPFIQDIPINTTNPDYLELYFGDDSINNHDYTITASQNNQTLFQHTYINEQSNIIRIPTADNNLQPNDTVTIRISCEDSCPNTQFKLYDIDHHPTLKTAQASHSADYRYYWYSLFLIVIGLTLIPFTKENKQ